MRKYNVGGPNTGGASPSISISLPGVENHDTERRRQIALKALSERLNRSPGDEAREREDDSPAGAQSWPLLTEESKDTSSDPLESVHVVPTTEPGTSEEKKISSQEGADGSA